MTGQVTVMANRQCGFRVSDNVFATAIHRIFREWRFLLQRVPPTEMNENSGVMMKTDRRGRLRSVGRLR